jgi:HEPN domain-containing protein
MKRPLPGYVEALGRIQAELGPTYKPLLIGIDGAWGIGKSHFASWLAWQLGIAAIPLDLFLIRDSEPLDWRTQDLALAINSRLNLKKPVIVEGILLLDALGKIPRKPDFLIFVRADAGVDLGQRFPKYFARMKPESHAHFHLEGYKDTVMSRKTSPAKKHASIENISIAGVKMKMGPYGLYFYAEHFLNAAKIASDGTGFNPAKYYLACHSLECILKAFLSLKGHSIISLSGLSYGHDLTKLLAQAEKDSLATMVELTEQQKFQINRASIYYGEKVYEYPAVAETLTAYQHLPDLPTVIALTETLIDKLREPCLNAE